MRELRFSIELTNVEIDLTILENNFSISKLPQHENLTAQLKEIHRHSDFEMFILPNSSLTVHTLTDTFLFHDSVVIIPPTLGHLVSYDGQCGYYLYFALKNIPNKNDAPYLELLRLLKQNITAFPLTDDERFYTQKIDLALQNESQTEILPHLITLFFFELFSKQISKQEHESLSRTKSGKYLHTIELYLASHYTESIRLSDLAEELYLCPKQVSRILKTAYDCSISELVNRRRLEAACFLLQYTKLEIAEIAAQVGYEHENYFYTLFKKMHGVTPKQYRGKKPSKNCN